MTPAAAVLVLALATGAIRQAPGKVKYPNEKGLVTFDHAGHVANREKCAACHADGPVAKIELDKRKAHALCVGCHASRREGPSRCDGCHGKR